MAAPTFAGLYKGVVASNIDPLDLNRLLVQVEDVMGPKPCIWASPHAAFAGMNVVPAISSGVWIEFQNGDVERAVWTGFWRGGTADAPPVGKTVTPGVPQVVLGTPTQNYLLITDAPGPTGGIQLQLHGPSGPYIKINESGIEISCGPGQATIRLAGTSVDINNGGLTVLK